MTKNGAAIYVTMLLMWETAIRTARAEVQQQQLQRLLLLGFAMSTILFCFDTYWSFAYKYIQSRARGVKQVVRILSERSTGKKDPFRIDSSKGHIDTIHSSYYDSFFYRQWRF